MALMRTMEPRCNGCTADLEDNEESQAILNAVILNAKICYAIYIVPRDVRRPSLDRANFSALIVRIIVFPNTESGIKNVSVKNRSRKGVTLADAE